MKQKTDRTLLLLLIACVVASAVAYQTVFGEGGNDAQASSQASPSSYNPPEIHSLAALKSERNYAAIDRKPIFFESRKPPQAPNKVKTKPVQIRKPKLEVVGIVSETDKKIALLKPEKTTEVLALSSGEIISGWNIVLIEDTHIILESGDHRERYAIKDYPKLELGKSKEISGAPSGKYRLIEIK